MYPIKRAFLSKTLASGPFFGSRLLWVKLSVRYWVKPIASQPEHGLGRMKTQIEQKMENEIETGVIHETLSK